MVALSRCLAFLGLLVAHVDGFRRVRVAADSATGLQDGEASEVAFDVQAVLNAINSKRRTPLCFNAKLMAAADEHVYKLVKDVDLHPEDVSTADYLNTDQWSDRYEIRAYDPMEMPAVDFVNDWLMGQPEWLEAMTSEKYQAVGYSARSFMGAGAFHTLVLGKPMGNVEACDSARNTSEVVAVDTQAVLDEINSKREAMLCFNTKLMAAADEHVYKLVKDVDLHPEDVSTADYLNTDQWSDRYEIRAYDSMEMAAVDVVKDWLKGWNAEWLDAMTSGKYQAVGYAARSFKGAGAFHTLILGKPTGNVEACD